MRSVSALLVEPPRLITFASHRVFETVRSKTGMALPGDGAEASSPVDSVKEDAPVSPVDSYHGNNDANDGKEEKETSA